MHSPTRCILQYFSSAQWHKIWAKYTTWRLYVWQSARLTPLRKVTSRQTFHCSHSDLAPSVASAETDDTDDDLANFSSDFVSEDAQLSTKTSKVKGLSAVPQPRGHNSIRKQKAHNHCSSTNCIRIQCLDKFTTGQSYCKIWFSISLQAHSTEFLCCLTVQVCDFTSVFFFNDFKQLFPMQLSIQQWKGLFWSSCYSRGYSNPRCIFTLLSCLSLNYTALSALFTASSHSNFRFRSRLFYRLKMLSNRNTNKCFDEDIRKYLDKYLSYQSDQRQHHQVSTSTNIECINKYIRQLLLYSRPSRRATPTPGGGPGGWCGVWGVGQGVS